jgi:predicted transcriptional regulator/DNA-binding XRE family transcriptional regulator
MAVRGLTGSRIRERRNVLGLRQSGLARTVGISAAYLNLIEHNRRRIGGKLLSDIAEALEVDPSVLAEGAEAGVVADLREAAARLPEAGAELERAEEFAGRFGGWAGLVAGLSGRVAELERTVETLTDRLAHDPDLAASLHELLSTVTAINSTASILVETREIEDEWRTRFHRNMHEDSQRLAESSQALVRYLETAARDEAQAGSPHEELELWLQRRGFQVAELERALPMSPAAILQQEDAPQTAAARELAEDWLIRYGADAEVMPLAEFQAAARKLHHDPVALAVEFRTDLAAVLRRIASLDTPEGAGQIGLAICDGSGTLSCRKPAEGYVLPRYGAACPHWPLYQALSQPMQPVRALVEVDGRDQLRFLTYAVAQPAGPVDFDTTPVYEATMLMLPVDRVRRPDGAGDPQARLRHVCPRGECRTRREARHVPDPSQAGVARGARA